MPSPRHLTVAAAALGFAVLGCGRTDAPTPTPTEKPAKTAVASHDVALDVPGMT